MRSMAWGLLPGSAWVSRTTDCGQSSTHHYRAGCWWHDKNGGAGAPWCPPRPPHASAAGRGAPHHLTIDFTHSAHARGKGREIGSLPQRLPHF